MNTEAIELIKLFRKLDSKRVIEFCYMLQGAVFIARNIGEQKGA